MPLQGAQVRAIQSPVFRAHWPDRAKLFAQVDELIRTRGEGCSRIHAIWDLLMEKARTDLALYDWFVKAFPGVSMRAGGGTFPRPDGKTKPTEIEPAPRRGVRSVMKALDVIQSFRKS